MWPFQRITGLAAHKMLQPLSLVILSGQNRLHFTICEQAHSLICPILSLKNDESGIGMVAALCAKNGDTAFRAKVSLVIK